MIDLKPADFTTLPPIVKICAMGKDNALLERIKKGEDFRMNNDWPAREAAHRGHYSIIEILLDNGVPVDTKEGALLKLSCAGGHLSAVRVLVKYEADISINDYEAYKWAIAKDRKNIVDYLEPLVQQKKFFDKYLTEKN